MSGALLPVPMDRMESLIVGWWGLGWSGEGGGKEESRVRVVGREWKCKRNEWKGNRQEVG